MWKDTQCGEALPEGELAGTSPQLHLGERKILPIIFTDYFYFLDNLPQIINIFQIFSSA